MTHPDTADDGLRLVKRKAMRLFGFWVELPPPELASRIAWLRDRAPDIHLQLVALARADDRARGFLDGESLSGRRIGPWTLERLLGAGGMGQVWLARRDDGFYEGRAAIKMLHDLATVRGASERFAREGQLLARLSHPNIARLLDAGVTPDSRRYLVLEHVAGRRLDEECDARRLDVPGRLRLFRQVCQAVIHAHSNLVVHRDLKPSNVLVTADGQVKLLDFGVAKLLEREPEESAQITRQAGAALTPAYAAPEQIEGGPITTATDVYALGVILYELLTAALPHGASSPALLARAIVLDVPVKLSAREVTEAAAASRGTTPSLLRKQLAGDLDVIVHKALKKDPAERYPTAQALEADLERYLREEPISARRDSTGYRARKFVRRHRVGVAATGLTLAAVIAGIIGVAWQARVARREARTAQAAQRFLVGLFEANSTEKSSSVEAQATTARELLDLGRRRIGTELRDEPEVRLQMLRTLSEMYFQIDRPDEAEPLDRERVELLRSLGRSRTQEMAEAINNHGMTLSSVDREAEASARFDEALRLLESMGSRRSEVGARVLWNIAEQKRHESPALAIPLLEESVGIFRGHPESGQLPNAFGLLASVYGSVGRLKDATATLEEGLAIVRAHHEPGSLFEINLLSRLADIELARNHFGAAQKALEETWRKRTVRLGDRHEDTLFSRATLALVLARGGERERALEHIEAVIAALGDDPSHLAPQQWGRGLFYKGQILLDAGQPAAARRTLDRIGPLWEQKLARTGIYGRYLLARSRLRSLEGDGAEAIELSRRGRSIVQALGVPCHAGGWAADQALAVALQDAGRLDEAAPLVRAVAECRSSEVDDLPFRAAAALGKAREAAGRGDATAALVSADEAVQRIAGSQERVFHALDEAEAQRLAGRALAVLGRGEEAKVRLRSSLALLQARQVPDSPAIAAVRADLAGR